MHGRDSPPSSSTSATQQGVSPGFRHAADRVDGCMQAVTAAVVAVVAARPLPDPGGGALW